MRLLGPYPSFGPHPYSEYWHDSVKKTSLVSTSYLCFESSSSRSGSSKKNKVIKLVDITDIQKVTRKKKKKIPCAICISNKLTSTRLSRSCSTKFCPSYQEVGWASLSPHRPPRRYHIEICSASFFKTHRSLTCRQTTICTHTHTCRQLRVCARKLGKPPRRHRPRIKPTILLL